MLWPVLILWAYGWSHDQFQTETTGSWGVALQIDAMLKRFLNELGHRHVLKTAVGYAIITAAVVEFTDIVTPALGLSAELL